MAKTTDATVFAFFNEIGILSQLSGAMLQSVLPNGVHPSHFAIVNHLTLRGDGKTPVKIASAMQVTKATMTHSLKVLSDHGFVETRPSETDGRAKCVYLTEKGIEFRKASVEAVQAKFSDLFSNEDIALMQEIGPKLAGLRKTLDDARD